MTRTRRDERWEELEGWVKEELDKARQRLLLAESFDEMEEIVVEMGQALEQEMLAAGAEQREVEGPPRCRECGEKMKRKGRTPRRIKTSQGTVRYERGRWVCPGCGANLFPPG